MDKRDETEAKMKDPKRLCILFEPTVKDLENYPFLHGAGGIMQMGRHPVFLHYCNAYNALCAFRRKKAIMLDIGISEKDEEFLETEQRYRAIERQLLLLKSGKGMYQMKQLLPGGELFSDPDFIPDSTK